MKLIHFVRHGHATHNAVMEEALKRGVEFGEGMLVAMSDPALHDARLTALGVDQAQSLGRQLEGGLRLGGATLIAVSPLSRTLQTANMVGLSTQPRMRRQSRHVAGVS